VYRIQPHSCLFNRKFGPLFFGTALDTLSGTEAARNTDRGPPLDGSGPGSLEPEIDRRRNVMLWTIFVILLVLWLLGLVSGQVFGGFVHILLVVAAVVLVLQLLSGRRAV
jgi:hypothetical protein